MQVDGLSDEDLAMLADGGAQEVLERRRAERRRREEAEERRAEAEAVREFFQGLEDREVALLAEGHRSTKHFSSKHGTAHEWGALLIEMPAPVDKDEVERRAVAERRRRMLVRASEGEGEVWTRRLVAAGLIAALLWG